MTEITTVEQLKALPEGTVLRLHEGSLAERKQWRDGSAGLHVSGSRLGYSNEDWSLDFTAPDALIWQHFLPATVLHPTPQPSTPSDALLANVLEVYTDEGVTTWLKAWLGADESRRSLMSSALLTQSESHQPVTPQPSSDDPIPRYAQVDIWMALFGADTSEKYEPFREEHGFAETWARLCAEVQARRTPQPSSAGEATSERELLELTHTPEAQSDGDYCERSWWECSACGEGFEWKDEAGAWRHAFEQAGFHRTPPAGDEFRAAVRAERLTHAGRGYSLDHDAEHGVPHLLTWAMDYAARGEHVKAMSLVDAALFLETNGPAPIASEPSDTDVERMANGIPIDLYDDLDGALASIGGTVAMTSDGRSIILDALALTLRSALDGDHS